MIGIIVILFFVLVMLVFVGAYMWYVTVRSSPRYQLKRRLRALASESDGSNVSSELKIELLKDMGAIDRALFQFSLIRKLDVLLDNAGQKTDVKFFALIIVVVSIFCYFIAFVAGLNGLLALIGVAVGIAIPLYVLVYKKNRRLVKFTEQFPDAIEMVSRSLKAGHSLNSAMEMIETEMPDPVGGIFKTAYEEQSFGLSMKESLDHMVMRIPSADLKFFVLALNIHREIGGNLGEILERLAKTIRDRIKIRRQVRVYSAQARVSGYILAVAPIVMTLLLLVALPGYMDELLSVDWGKYAIGLALGAQVIGFLVIKKIINIRI